MKKPLIPHLRLDQIRARLGLSGAWIAGVGCAFVGTLAVALCATILFIGVFDADAVSQDVESDVESLSRDDLSRSVTIIDRRMRDFERLKTSPPAFATP
jgi:hypothetical protein